MVRVLTLTALLVSALVTSAFAQPAPPLLTAPVNDFANVIDAASEARLDALVRQLQSASGDIIVVATVPTFKPYADLPSYAVKMFENGGRGIGQRSGDSGVLVVLAVEDRQVRVEVGYGLEGTVTDGFAGQVSRETMIPFFRRGDFGGGLVAGTTELAQRLAEARGVTLELAQPARGSRDRRAISISPFGILFLLFILFLISRGGGGPRSMGRTRRWRSGAGPFGPGIGWGGGGWGGGFGGGGFGGGGGGFGGFGGGRSGGGGGGGGW
ncbi:MAG: TPM domain-containing protein [Acidobacteria bacterium]|nr:TPM domain-containing protein [Acidobacteriota bacterium]